MTAKEERPSWPQALMKALPAILSFQQDALDEYNRLRDIKKVHSFFFSAAFKALNR